MSFFYILIIIIIYVNITNKYNLLSRITTFLIKQLVLFLLLLLFNKNILFCIAFDFYPEKNILLIFFWNFFVFIYF